MPGSNWQNIKQKLSNTQRLNSRFLKIIRFLHPRYHQKIIGDILKNIQKTSVIYKQNRQQKTVAALNLIPT